jgi:uncharacterized repeat protein (TIGR01451 family)
LKKRNIFPPFLLFILLTSQIIGVIGDASNIPQVDVDKYYYTGISYPEDRDPGGRDKYACWLAVSSNILTYGGWAIDRSDYFGLKPAQYHAYHDFLAQFPDEGGYGKVAWETYLNWYYPDVNIEGLILQETDTTGLSLVPLLKEWLDAGYVVELGVYLKRDGDYIGGHAVTCWGYNERSTDPSSPYYDEDENVLLFVHITDSDDFDPDDYSDAPLGVTPGLVYSNLEVETFPLRYDDYSDRTFLSGYSWGMGLELIETLKPRKGTINYAHFFKLGDTVLLEPEIITTTIDGEDYEQVSAPGYSSPFFYKLATGSTYKMQSPLTILPLEQSLSLIQRNSLEPVSVNYQLLVSEVEDEINLPPLKPLYSPIADVNGPYELYEGDPEDAAIEIDGSGSSDLDGAIVLYEYDFNGDGVYDYSSPSIDKVYTNYYDSLPDGTYTVVLRVTDDDGLQDIDSSTVVVKPQEADLDITKSCSTSDAFVGDTVHYTVTVTNNGPHDAVNVVINDDIGGEETQGTILAGECYAWNYEYTIDPADYDILTNDVEVTSDILDPDPENNNAEVSVNVYKLVVIKDTSTYFTRTYEWDISKVVDPDSVYLTVEGSTVDVDYTVDVYQTGFSDDDYGVSGTIWVYNPAPITAVINSVSDIVSSGIDASTNFVVDFPYYLAAGDALIGTYSTDLPDDSNRLNTATATLQNYDRSLTDGEWDVSGIWTFDVMSSVFPGGNPYSKDMWITLQESNGDLTGFGGNSPYPTSHLWTVSGTVVDDIISFELTYTTVPLVGYVASFTGTIDSNGELSGTWSDVWYSDSGTWVSTSGNAVKIIEYGETDFTDTVNFGFGSATITEVDKTVHVTDSFKGLLGTIAATEGEPWAGVTYEYTRTIGPYDDLGNYEVTNTARIVETDQSAEATVYVTVLPFSTVTTSSLCPFDKDKDSENGKQSFNLLFTNDPTDISTYKLTASNPGQFYYNAFFVGTPGEDVDIDLIIPEPFETQGAVPIHIYSDVSLSENGCFTPLNEILVVAVDFGTTGEIHIDDVTVPDTGLVYVTLHLDYGWKKQTGYSVGIDYFANNVDDDYDLADGTPYTFSYEINDALQPNNPTIYNINIFKNDPGFVGIVTVNSESVEGASIQIHDSTGALVGETLTDENGYYFFYYKHTGKAAVYSVTVTSPETGIITFEVTLKSNKFVWVPFEIARAFNIIRHVILN